MVYLNYRPWWLFLAHGTIAAILNFIVLQGVRIYRHCYPPPEPKQVEREQISIYLPPPLQTLIIEYEDRIFDDREQYLASKLDMENILYFTPRVVPAPILPVTVESPESQRLMRDAVMATSIVTFLRMISLVITIGVIINATVMDIINQSGNWNFWSEYQQFVLRLSSTSIPMYTWACFELIEPNIDAVPMSLRRLLGTVLVIGIIIPVMTHVISAYIIFTPIGLCVIFCSMGPFVLVFYIYECLNLNTLTSRRRTVLFLIQNITSATIFGAAAWVTSCVILFYEGTFWTEAITQDWILKRDSPLTWIALINAI